VTSKAIAIQKNSRTPVRMFMALIVGSGLALALVFAQANPAAAQDRPASFADLAEQISTSVVNITTTTTVAGRTGPQGIVPEGSPFEDFFNNLDPNDRRAPRQSSALGSGFVISADGYIVTNNHVIEGADEIQIEFFPGEGQPSELLPAELVGTDPNTDIALLKVEYDTPLDFVEFGDSDAVGARVAGFLCLGWYRVGPQPRIVRYLRRLHPNGRCN